MINLKNNLIVEINVSNLAFKGNCINVRVYDARVFVKPTYSFCDVNMS